VRTVLGRMTRKWPAVLAAAGLAGAVLMGGTAPPAAAAVPAAFGWGTGEFGEVGNGTNGTYSVPVPVALTLPAAPVQVAASSYDGAAVLAGGALAMWGDNSAGQLGNGTLTQQNSPVVVPGLTGITQVALGGGYVLALDSAGTVWSWGSNNFGQLGNGTTTSIPGSNPTPVPVPGLSGITQVSASGAHSLALRADGTVFAWGDNQYGELGDGSLTSISRPERVPGLTGITKVIGGQADSFAITAGGTLLAWGNNSYGALGNGTRTGMSATPAPVPGLAGVTAVSSNLDATLAVASPSGTMYSWGDNRYGLTGDGTNSPHFSPEPTSLTGVAAVSAGQLVSGAVLSSGKLMTWGDDAGGSLGTGSAAEATGVFFSPQPVGTLAGVTQLAFGYDSGAAIGSPALRVPDVRGLTQSEAASALQAAGFALGRVSLIVDLTCEYLGEVKTQSPAAGTIAAAGTAVSVGIGKVGGKCL
jgi:hypothetical protein